MSIYELVVKLVLAYAAACWAAQQSWMILSPWNWVTYTTTGRFWGFVSWGLPPIVRVSSFVLLGVLLGYPLATGTELSSWAIVGLGGVIGSIRFWMRPKYD